jgi:hypothetical protein
LAAAKQRKISSQDRRIKYILDIAEKSGLRLSIASETETRRILNKLPALSEEIVKNRYT